MAFLSPFLLAGLAAIAIPIFIHLIQRERKQVVMFPSLMFVRRVPYQSVRRRKIRHWFLLAMRAAALALIVGAFARPFFTQSALAVQAQTGAREVAVLLDHSASMGYADRWVRAQAAARQAVQSLAPDDRATIVLFARGAEADARSTTDRAPLLAAIDAAAVGSGSTRYGPALKLAQSVLEQSQLPRREVVLISDFQKSGWQGAEGVRFPQGTVLTPVDVSGGATSNLSVSSVAFDRTFFSNQERVAVTAGVVNRGAQAAASLPVVLEVDGRRLEEVAASVSADGSASVTFAPFTLSSANVRGTVRIVADQDPLPQDNAFHFVLSPGQPVPVLVLERPGAADSTLYLTRALGIGNAPAFRVESMAFDRATPASLAGRSVVIVDGAAIPRGGMGDRLRTFAENGGGIWVLLGERGSWPTGGADWLPGQLGAMVDRATGRGGALGFLDYGHPIFELFKAPRSGDFSGARFFRYRAMTAGANDRVLARFDDGAVALVEKPIGRGHVVVWTSTLDDTLNDLALKPVFLPFVHQISRYLAGYAEPTPWLTVGQVLDPQNRTVGDQEAVAAPAPALAPAQARLGSERVALTPTGRRVPFGARDRPALLELDEQGFYEVRSVADATVRPFPVAVNLDASESDLTGMDPRELAAAVAGNAAASAAASATPVTLAPQEAERRQAVWWYLLVAGVLLLAAETAVSNALPRVLP